MMNNGIVWAFGHLKKDDVSDAYRNTDIKPTLSNYKKKIKDTAKCLKKKMNKRQEKRYSLL